MRAIVQDRYGPPETLRLAEVDRPRPEARQVCVEVQAASLNMYDWHMMSGYPLMARLQAGVRTPGHPIPGADVAGTVADIGEEVTGLRPGDEVFGLVDHGALAEYVCGSEESFAPLPEGVDLQAAAATPMAALTALQGLRDVGGLQAGQRVLVNGASGGVGTFAVQIAKELGAEVTAVCSTAKVEMVSRLGADRVFDYTRHDFSVTERDYDLLFDNVGDRPWSQTRRVLAGNGVNVTITGPKHRVAGPLRNLLFRKAASLFDSRRFAWFTSSVRRQDLEDLAAMLVSGGVRPVLEEIYPLEKAAEAMRRLGEGHAAGKLVITV
ncbi:MAG TPA: NAD(P)-dependent alcohol dehydrogenase [Acidimicrobiia bacterium]|nr:NAD(P)-dependent alcohol dehydrogenase [Acidimicrobiia bacterium]